MEGTCVATGTRQLVGGAPNVPVVLGSCKEHGCIFCKVKEGCKCSHSPDEIGVWLDGIGCGQMG